MKKILNMILVWFLYLTTVYSQENTRGYSLRGTINGMPDGTRIALVSAESRNDTIATALSKNGMFVINGKLKLDGELHFLRIDAILLKKSLGVYLVNDSIDVSGDLAKWPDSISVKGSEPNDRHYELLNLLRVYKPNVQKVQTELNNTVLLLDSIRNGLIKGDSIKIKDRKKALEKDNDIKVSEYYSIWSSFLNKYPNSYYSPQSIIKAESFLHTNGMEAAYAKLTTKVKESFYGYKLKKMIEQAQHLEVIVIGRIAPDFSSKTPEGKIIMLSEVVKTGKLTLVDFWGSWCKPCRQAIPNIKRVYDLFHDKGFNVLGVAAEFSVTAWKKALVEEKMPWVQVSQIKGRSEDANLLYAVNGLPAYLLIDGDGKIVSIDLPMSKIPSKGPTIRGEGLYKTVEDILGKNK